MSDSNYPKTDTPRGLIRSIETLLNVVSGPREQSQSEQLVSTLLEEWTLHVQIKALHDTIDDNSFL